MQYIEHAVFVSFVETKTQTLPWTFFVQMALEKSRLQALSSAFWCNFVAQSVQPMRTNWSKMHSTCWLNSMISGTGDCCYRKSPMDVQSTLLTHGNTEIVPLENLRMPPSLFWRITCQSRPSQVHSRWMQLKIWMRVISYGKVNTSKRLAFLPIFIFWMKLKIVFNCN